MTDQDTSKPAEDDEILSVSDLAPPRKKIEFSNGAVCEIASPLEFSLAQRAEYDRLHKELNRLQNKEKLTKAQETSLGSTTDKLARLALPDITDDEFGSLRLFEKDAAIGFLVASWHATMQNLGTAVSRAMGIEEVPEEAIPDLAELTSEK